MLWANPSQYEFSLLAVDDSWKLSGTLDSKSVNILCLVCAVGWGKGLG